MKKLFYFIVIVAIGSLFTGCVTSSKIDVLKNHDNKIEKYVFSGKSKVKRYWNSYIKNDFFIISNIEVYANPAKPYMTYKIKNVRSHGSSYATDADVTSIIVQGDKKPLHISCDNSSRIKEKNTTIYSLECKGLRDEFLNVISNANDIFFNIRLVGETTTHQKGGVGDMQYCKKISYSQYEYNKCIKKRFKKYETTPKAWVNLKLSKELKSFAQCVKNNSCK